MEKLKLENLDILKDNIIQLKKLFPQVFVEEKIDFQMLKELLGENIDIAKESFDKLVNYPDPYCIELRKKIAEFNSVNMNNIIVGNGATEILFLYIRALKPKKVLILAPCFAEYERALKSVSANIEYFELKESDNFYPNIINLKKEIENNNYDLLLLCNPNNPTGKFLKLAETEEILKECNKYDTKLFIDEAFIEFLEDGMKESIINTEENKKNLFVTRAFTKFFAIPGLRLGYGMYFDKELEKEISEKKEPWSVNNIAEMAGLTVLDDTEYIEKTLKWIAEEKVYMYEKLNEISGIKVYETEVNFITGKIDEKLFSEGLNVKILREKMLEHGILIRDASNFKFLDERFFRLAIKDRESNDRVIEMLREIFREKGVKSFNE